MRFSGAGLLLDIEGTISSVSFVYDVMFPFVRRELEHFLMSSWQTPELRRAREQIARDAGHANWEAWTHPQTDELAQRKQLAAEVQRLMVADLKVTGLKQLQGLIWQAGFESGELVAQLYDDVLPAIRSWREAGREVRIYSSGSVHSQELFFAHTVDGDVLPLFDGHYDTEVGSKRESTSYQAIARDWGLPAEQILFVSDLTAELDAAAAAGLQTALAVRPGNAPVSDDHVHPAIRSFAEIKLDDVS